MLEFLSPVPRKSKQANKHTRTLLDFLREEADIPIEFLNELIPKIIGRPISDFRWLSPSENKVVREYINAHYKELLDQGRNKRGWKQRHYEGE